MNQKLFNNQFVRIDYQAENSKFDVVWKAETDDMEDSDFRAIMLSYFELVKEFKPTGVYIDTSSLFFTVVPETQTWVDQEINAHINKYGVKKLAVILSSEFYSQVATIQTFEEENAVRYLQVAYFESETEAKRWLIAG
jgi:hypothetical protein